MKSITFVNQDTLEEFVFQTNRSLGTMIGKVEGFEYPTVMPVIEDVPNAGGAVYITSKFGRRRIALTLYIGEDCLDQRVELVKVLRQSGRQKLIKFTTLDDKLLQFEAEVVDLVNPYSAQPKPLLIQLIAGDYRFYSQTEHEFTTVQTVIMGGLDIPADIPYDIGGEGSDVSSIDNVGSDVSDPVFRVDGPGTGFTVGNQTTGEEFVLDYTLTTGHYIEVDVANRTVKYDGITNIYSAFSGDFWDLEPGDNTIRFLVDSGSDSETLLTINWRDAYSGI